MIHTGLALLLTRSAFQMTARLAAWQTLQRRACAVRSVYAGFGGPEIIRTPTEVCVWLGYPNRRSDYVVKTISTALMITSKKPAKGERCARSSRASFTFRNS